MNETTTNNDTITSEAIASVATQLRTRLGELRAETTRLDALHAEATRIEAVLATIDSVNGNATRATVDAPRITDAVINHSAFTPSADAERAPRKATRKATRKTTRKATTRKATRKAPDGRTKFPNAGTLVETIVDVLRVHGAPMTAAEVMRAVNETGYRTTSKNFRQVIYVALSKNAAFKRNSDGAWSLARKAGA